MLLWDWRDRWTYSPDSSCFWFYSPFLWLSTHLMFWLKSTPCQSVSQSCLTSCLCLSSLCSLVPTKDVKHLPHKYLVSSSERFNNFLKQLLTGAFIKQTGSSRFFFWGGDYFQQRINLRLVLWWVFHGWSSVARRRERHHTMCQETTMRGGLVSAAVSSAWRSGDHSSGTPVQLQLAV